MNVGEAMEKRVTAGQQEAKAALAALAASGNAFALGQLWEINRGRPTWGIPSPPPPPGGLQRRHWEYFHAERGAAWKAGAQRRRAPTPA